MSRTLKYYVDGEEYSGTLNDYAKARKHQAYDIVEVSNYIINDRGDQVQPEITFSGYNYDDYGTVTIKVRGYGEASYVVDGRA